MTCPHFGPCGGCQLQHLPYPAQLDRKRQVLEALFARSLGGRAPIVEPAIGMPVSPDGMPWGFRHKASFVFGPAPRSRRGFVMGHYEAGSQRVVAVRECPVHATRANRIAFALRDRLLRAGLGAAGPRLDGILRHLVIRTTCDEREAIAMLVVTRNDKALRTPLRSLLASDDRPDGLYVSVHDRPGPYMVGDETKHLEGRTHVREACGGVSFLVSPTAFFQTNPLAADVLVRLVTGAVTRETSGDGIPHVLDLYAGSGLFALPLAAAGVIVTAVEESAQAVRDGEANQRLNRIPRERLRFVRDRVEAWARTLGTAPKGGIGRRTVPESATVPVVILDPPRQGCPPVVIDSVFRRLAPRRAIYVSCNPEALAAELPAMLDAGYDIARVEPVDMFPHTEHIETVTTLDRKAR